MSIQRRQLVIGLFGLAFGFSLGNIGFADFGELHRMFTFQDMRMFWTFAGGVIVASALYFALNTQPRQATSVHKGVVPGAVLFGAGWAISGGCPSIPLVQLGTGYLPAIVTMAGIATGMRLFRKVNARVLHIDAGACGL